MFDREDVKRGFDDVLFFLIHAGSSLSCSNSNLLERLQKIRLVFVKPDMPR